MSLSRKQRKNREAEMQTCAGRRKRHKREKQKAKKLEIRLAEEAKMAEYLKASGWKQGGPMMDVWSIAGWERPETCYMTLRHAYRTQKNVLDAYERPAGIDDDLGAKIMGD